MYSIVRLGDRSVSLPLAADDVLEFHAARLLLLLELCGVSGRIDGLTKMAKLDFFVRYPEFYAVARAVELGEPGTPFVSTGATVESAMVRHHYGPWDKRYYHVLAHLESHGLLEVRPMRGTTYQLSLTPRGREVASELAETDSFGGISERMRDVKSVLGGKSGTKLKNLVYRLFDEEVGKLSLGEEIR